MPEKEGEKLVFDKVATYLAMIENSAGTRMFNQCFFRNEKNELIDVCQNGKFPCAFFVSSVLEKFGWITRAHVTVEGLYRDMVSCDWHRVVFKYLDNSEEYILSYLANIYRPVIHWYPWPEAGLEHEHIGFYLGNGICVSTNSFGDAVVKHDLFYRNVSYPPRKIKGFYFHRDMWYRDKLVQ